MINIFAFILFMSSAIAQVTKSKASFLNSSVISQSCQKFKWEKMGEYERAGLFINVSVNGKNSQYQLDTGASDVYIYNEKTKLSEDDAINISLKVGSINYKKFPAHELKNMGSEGGTIGLNAFMGNYILIDFSTQKFCAFSPSEFKETDYSFSTKVNAIIRNGKFFVPIKFDGVVNRNYLYDTGSSLLPFTTDVDNWKKLTGLDDVEKATKSIKGKAWGKEIKIYGAPFKSKVEIGNQDISGGILYANPNDKYSDWNYIVEGVIGNERFFDKTIILDMTSYPRFMIVKPN
jgi:hypothetical protein